MCVFVLIHKVPASNAMLQVATKMVAFATKMVAFATKIS